MSLEMNFDGLVGPTHNYAGLSHGNLASNKNRGLVSNPRAAALQGVEKMRVLIGMGIPQGVLPPHERPFLPGLKSLGYTGPDAQCLETAFRDSPALIANLSSASSMWTANAATVSPSADTGDGRIHFTPANLIAMPHRALEGPQTTRILKRVFKDERYFTVHEALPNNPLFGDEGAANHNRMAPSHGAAGLEIFVHGREALAASPDLQFPARQTLEASQSVARLHRLRETDAIHIKQSAKAINAGAFHNDVVCVANENLLFFHEAAFDDVKGLKDSIRKRTESLEFLPSFLMASEKDVPLSDAITSYLFNSQLITRPDGGMSLILPIEAQITQSTYDFVQDCIAAGETRLDKAHYLDLRQSMSNGGGPACLRLRVQMTEDQMAAVHPGVVMTLEKLDGLETLIKKYYRDRLSLNDLGDPLFLNESRAALNALTQFLDFENLYDFQRCSTGSVDCHD